MREGLPQGWNPRDQKSLKALSVNCPRTATRQRGEVRTDSSIWSQTKWPGNVLLLLIHYDLYLLNFYTAKPIQPSHSTQSLLILKGAADPDAGVTTINNSISWTTFEAISDRMIRTFASFAFWNSQSNISFLFSTPALFFLVFLFLFFFLFIWVKKKSKLNKLSK